MTFNKKILAGLVAFAAASSAQAVTVAANDGWTLGVSGQVNQFLVYTDDNTNNVQTTELRDGLLPAFISFDMKSPEINGLTMAAHISLSPSTNTLAQGGGTSEQREVYFTVDGSFGQILAGKALGLYGSSAILNEQTLFGVGWGTMANGTTTLGGIGIGYDYADWRSQIRWTSNDMNGFKVALAAVDSQGPGFYLPGVGPVGPLAILNENPALGGNSHVDSENLRYEAQLSYAGAFDGGSFALWAEGAYQNNEDMVAGSVLGGAALADSPEDARYWAVGGTVKVNGFEAAAQYSDAEDTLSTVGGALIKGEWSNWFVQGGYRFNGTTLVSVAYAELEDDLAVTDDTTDRLTVGVYHDVNSNLKLVAEYSQIENDNAAGIDQDIFSLGGFVFF